MSSLIVIPCFNERIQIKRVLEGLRYWCPSNPILVVDDGSTDGLKECLRGVFCMRSKERRGYAFSLSAGFRWAIENGFTKAISCDGDGQHLPQQVARVEQLHRRYPWVVGSRYHSESKVLGEIPKERFELNREMTSWVNDKMKSSYSDVFSGLIGWDLKSFPLLGSLGTDWGILLRLWMRVAYLSLPVAQVPITCVYQVAHQRVVPQMERAERRRFYLEILEKEWDYCQKKRI